jgi:predicted metal-dependent phosphoesterase TrpH
MQSRIQTLHSHTIISDGRLTHEQFLRAAEKENLGVVIFTDHDALPDKEILENIAKTKFTTDWAMGIEISSKTPRESSSPTAGCHVLGLFIDPFNQNLLEYCKETKNKRIDRMKRIVKNLQDIGLKITPEECEKYANGAVVTSPHIVNAILNKEENNRLIENLLINFKKDAETDPIVAKKYQKMKNDKPNAYPYWLFLRDDSYVPNIAVHIDDKPDFDESVALIRNAGGIAILAHYEFSKDHFNLELLEKVFKKNRIDGAETVYGIWEWNTGMHDEMERDREKVKELVKKYNKIATGGPDAHKEKDLEEFSKIREYADETRGMVEEILKRKSFDLTWSSFDKKHNT